MVELFLSKPVLKDAIWGGSRLIQQLQKGSGEQRVAESWELSTHPSGVSHLEDGRALDAYLRHCPQALGTARESDDLPILIKLIDAAQPLSVQVHPDNAYAMEHEHQNGKAEVWYVMEAEKDAFIYCGFRRSYTRAEVLDAVRENRLTDLLARVPVRAGDVIYLAPGTVHALGGGVMVAEIQQNSDVTYRLYDYGRLGADGQPRELHLERAMDVATLAPTGGVMRGGGNCRVIAQCEQFQVTQMELDGTRVLPMTERSFCALLCVRGSVTVDTKTLKLGDCLFLPAQNGCMELEGTGTILLAKLPPRYDIGIDLGGTNLVSAAVDEDGVIYGRARMKTNAPRPWSAVFADMAICAHRAVSASGLAMEQITSVGVGCPGTVNPQRGMVEFSNNLEFHNAPLYSYLEQALGKPIFADNDANSAAWGEHLVTGGESLVMVTLGTGVGGGLVLDGRIWRGAYFGGAELGHMTLVKQGLPCTCGRRGCAEAYVSATALVARTRRAMEQHPDSAMWAVGDAVSGQTAFLADDAPAHRVVEEYLDDLGDFVVNLVNIFQPEVLAIGGGISGEGERLLEPLREKVRRDAFSRYGARQTLVKTAQLGNDAGLIGAALLWKNETK